MKIQICPYELNPITANSSTKREGVLLKIQFTDGAIGYADCHPWTGAGLEDAPVEIQLQQLRQYVKAGANAQDLISKMSPLLMRAMYFARLDATARKKGENLLAGLELPISHYFVGNVYGLNPQALEKIVVQGFDIIKVKLGKDLIQETRTLQYLCKQSNLRWRLDFNAQLQRDVFFAWWNDNKAWLAKRIDFIEDPFPYDVSAWQSWQQENQVALALDRFFPDSCQQWSGFQVAVLKPALQDIRSLAPKLLENNKRCVVTSYLGHPLEAVASTYEAAWLYSRFPHALQVCGLVSHLDCEPIADHCKLAVEGGILQPVSGSGYGFDEYLAGLDWLDIEE